MIPASLSKCDIQPPPFAASALVAVSALTTTSTQYDDYVHSQAASSSTGKQSTSAKNSPATPTTKPNSEPSSTVSKSPTTGNAANTTPAPYSAPVVVSGKTITPGGSAVTIGGTTYSLAASSSVLVVDGSTLTLEATLTAASSGGGIGSLVWSGIGGTEGSATLPSGSATGSGVLVTTFTGAANRVTGGMHWRYWLAALLVAVLAEW